MTAEPSTPAPPGGATLFDKLWDGHVVTSMGGGVDLLHVDRHLIHDLGGARGLLNLQRMGRPVRNPELTFATADHSVSTAPGRGDDSSPVSGEQLRTLRRMAREAGIVHFDLGTPGQGIVHVIGPELGLTLPGTLVVCGDSHTCTHGALGALAWGIGASEVTHVLATQTIVQRRPKRMLVSIGGTLQPGVTAKDLVMFLIGRIGVGGGIGHAVEFAGPAVSALPMEARLTLCNMATEFGSKIGLIAPDGVTFDYLHGRRFVPDGAGWDRALTAWQSLPGEPDAVFDRVVTLSAGEMAPQVTWGTSPEEVVAVDGRVPAPAASADPARQAAQAAALDYMGLQPGTPLADVAVDWVFIGSCANGRLSDLQEAAAVLRGRVVAPGVQAWVVPGSAGVAREAEAQGLDRVFRAAGFQWREPGCSLCAASNMERVPPGLRSVSTSNRNFMGRQGPGARTHLASPATAAASAIRGRIADARRMAG